MQIYLFCYVDLEWQEQALCLKYCMSEKLQLDFEFLKLDSVEDVAGEMIYILRKL
jgi:hypothetical protein